MQSNKLQHDMKPRDAVISFQCSAPNLVQVSEVVDGERVHHQEVERHVGPHVTHSKIDEVDDRLRETQRSLEQSVLDAVRQ